MTFDDKIELATIMADLTVAQVEQATVILAIAVAAKGHVSDELKDRAIAADKLIQEQHGKLTDLTRLSDTELAERH